MQVCPLHTPFLNSWWKRRKKKGNFCIQVKGISHVLWMLRLPVHIIEVYIIFEKMHGHSCNASFYIKWKVLVVVLIEKYFCFFGRHWNKIINSSIKI